MKDSIEAIYGIHIWTSDYIVTVSMLHFLTLIMHYGHGQEHSCSCEIHFLCHDPGHGSGLRAHLPSPSDMVSIASCLLR